MDHHLFCGNPCHQEYSSAAKIVSPASGYKRYAMFVSMLVLILGFVYFALLADAFYSGGDAGVKSKPNKIGLSLPLDIQAKPVVEILISRPLNGTRSPSQTMQVEGHAPANSVVAIYLNGTLTDSTIATGGNYRFPSVLLTKNANVIQTRFYADNGSSDASSAIMVFYADKIQWNEKDFSFFQNSSDNISRGNLNRKELVLTFEGGSEANSCAAILKALNEANIRSTIFLTREFIEKHPNLTRKIAAQHEVGNSQTQLNPQQDSSIVLSREGLQNELRKTEGVFQNVTGRRMARLWRAPYGEHNTDARKWAAELGYIHVAWTANARTRHSMDSLDWVPDSSSPGYFPALLIKERILSFGQSESEQANGSIILMHLGSQRAPSDRLDKWLPEIIQTFRTRGYEFITASELIDRQTLNTNTASK